MKGHVNSSGFPLQIGIKNIVDETFGQHQWKTLYSEHAWHNKQTGESGFIDLVIANQHGTQFLVVECKRVLNTSWIFMAENGNASSRRHAKTFIYSKSGGTIKRFDWFDITLEPTTPETQYCVIPGTGKNERPLIERTAAELVSSTEAFAKERSLINSSRTEDLGIFFNVIVTTAKLNTCSFNPASISLEDGSVDETSFNEVPYVRFRKQLKEIPTEIGKNQDHSEIDIQRIKENTIFVVNSVNMVNFLRDFDIDSSYQNNKYFR